MEVHEGGQVIAYDDIVSLEVLDDGEPVASKPQGRCSSLVVGLVLSDGSHRDIPFISSPQNRKSFVYAHTLEQARFLAAHLDEMR